MRSFGLLLTCVTCACSAQRVQLASETDVDQPRAQNSNALQDLAAILTAFNPAQGLRIASTGATSRSQARPVRMFFDFGPKKEARPNPTAVFETSKGTFTAELYLDKMPLTVSNFIDLAQQGQYDGLHFHRVIPNFMAQVGCPYTKNPFSPKAGKGMPAPYSYFKNLGTTTKVLRNDRGGIPDEFTASFANGKGSLAMANSGRPQTGGQQFFINVAENDYLNWWDDSSVAKHPVFGQITSNYKLIEKITDVWTVDNRPVVPIKLEKVTIEGL